MEIIEEAGNFEFINDVNFDESDGQFGVALVPFDKHNIYEYDRDKIFNSYKAFFACGKDIDESKGIGEVVGKLAQKSAQDVDSMLNNVDPNFADYLKVGLKYSGKQFTESVFQYGKLGLEFIGKYFDDGDLSLLLVDEFCGDSFKREICKLIEKKELDPHFVVLIKRYNKTCELETMLWKLGCADNVIGGDNLDALSKKAKDLYVKALNKKFKLDLDAEVDLHEDSDEEVDFDELDAKDGEEGKSQFRKLFGRVRKNKGKVASVFSILVIEELWRNGFLGGKKTDKKTKNSKVLKDLKDLKDLRNSARN